MPIYEYQCQSCGNVIEVIQRFGDRPRRKCKECSGKLEKLISRTSFHLKGGGWFAEGYGGGSKKSSTGDSSTPSTKTETSPKPSSDSKSKSD